MNTYNIIDSSFINSSLYKDFIKANSSNGFLKIRAYSINEALPIEGLRVVVSTIYNNNKIVFFEGETDSSGLINRIKLPTPENDTDNLVIPKTINYKIEVFYDELGLNRTYEVNMYENICVVQNINVPPKTLEVGVLWQ